MMLHEKYRPATWGDVVGQDKAVVAVSRKLALALWHVARGEAFDSSKLFDTRRLTGLDVAR